MRVHRFINVLVVALLLFALVPVSGLAAEAPSIQIVADKTTPAVGENVTFSINLKNFIAPANNLSSFEVKLQYDTAAWDAVSTQTAFGEYLNTLKANQYEMPVNKVGDGAVHFALSIFKSDQVNYFSGDGTLVTFQLKPKKNGNSSVTFSKSLVVQISQPGVNVTHDQVNSSVNIGGTAPTQPPVDPGTGGNPGSGSNPGSEVVPITPAEVERTRTTENGQVKEIIEFNGDSANRTIELAKKSQSKVVEIKVKNSNSEEADLAVLSISKETVSKLVNQNLALLITSEKGQIELSVETLRTLGKDISLELSQLTDSSKMAETEKQIADRVKNGRMQGSPTIIKTNFSGRTKVSLPLSEALLPKEATKLADYLKSLGVFVQHSDGTVELVKGDILYNTSKKPVSITIHIDKFSTFTVITDLSLKKTYTDEKEISAYALDAVYKAQELGIMSGINDEPQFAPAQLMTRAQFTKIMVTMLGEQPASNASISFSDVSKNHWAHGYIAKAVQMGIIKGVSPSTFNPGGTITREQIALMIGRAYKLKPSASPTIHFKDEQKISKEALPYIQVLQEKGIMMGSNGQFNPKQSVTREMAAVITVRVVEKLESAK
jgi:hypothetical protein